MFILIKKLELKINLKRRLQFQHICLEVFLMWSVLWPVSVSRAECGMISFSSFLNYLIVISHYLIRFRHSHVRPDNEKRLFRLLLLFNANTIVNTVSFYHFFKETKWNMLSGTGVLHSSITSIKNYIVVKWFQMDI